MSGAETFNETFIAFDKSIAELDERIADTEATLADLDSDNPRAETLRAGLQALRTQRKGAIWARDQAAADEDFPEWDEEAAGVTFGALRAGPFAQLQDDLHDAEAGDGGSSIRLVAAATVDAPYIDEAMDDRDQLIAVSSLHPFFREWAEARVTELMDPEGNVAGSGGSPPAKQPEAN